MQRGVRPLTLEYKGERTAFDMPGWYCDPRRAFIPART
jgi:hypothetical protein